MRSVRFWAAVASGGLAVSTAIVGGGVQPAQASTTRVALTGSVAPAADRTQRAGAVAGSSEVGFDLVLALRDPAGAASELRAVSDPGSPQFRHFLTDARWEALYAPTRSEVSSARSWLRSEGFTVGMVPGDRLFVPATGTARQVEKAFGTTLSYYKVNGRSVRLATGTISVPGSIAGSVTGVTGVNEYLATTNLTSSPHVSVTSVTKPAQEPPPPPVFKNPKPCSAYWGQLLDKSDSPSLYKPYKAPLPYDICGYTPDQLRSAYHVGGAGYNGMGVTIAIVDAYDSPTLLSDAQEYFNINDPAHPLRSDHFFNVQPPTVDMQTQCAGSTWFAEQALDVESEHSMAPAADILFVGAQDCQDTSLLAALNTAVTSGASVVSNSYGDVLGDLLTDQATKNAFDETFELAGATGVSVLYSSGDYGDNFGISGIAAPNYPASSPFVTSVGGTTLEINAKRARAAEYGWSTAKQELCETTTTTCPGTKPAGPLLWQVGGGGGTSYTYTEPYYQDKVVPPVLALRNAPLLGPVPMRVEPDISMDADAQSGMLIGLTETYPNGSVRFGEFKEGGTSLASPLLAGVVGDAIEVAGGPLGFLNPIIYKIDLLTPRAFYDIVPPAHPLSTAVIRVDYANTMNSAEGYIVSLRVIDYEGTETYCDGTGNCASRKVTLTTAPGFDSMTGIGSVGPDFFKAVSSY